MLIKPGCTWQQFSRKHYWAFSLLLASKTPALDKIIIGRVSFKRAGSKPFDDLRSNQHHSL
jgi:hypothetical protein